MSSLKDRICPITYRGICVTVGNQIRPCCASSQSFGTFSKLEDLLVAFQGEELKSIKKELNSGQFPAGCERCEKDESQGQISHRLSNFNRPYLSPKNLNTSQNQLEDLLSLEVVFSETCNLDCAFCNSTYSSKWKGADAEMFSLGLRDASLVKQKLSVLQDISQNDWQQFFLKVPRLGEITIKGGEPLLAKAFHRMIAVVQELGKKELIINVITNGTELTPELIKSIAGLNVNFIISIDGIDSVYEYIRGFRFQPLSKMITNYLAQTKQKKYFFNFTVCNLNILHLPEFCCWFNEHLSEKFPEKKLLLGLRQIVSTPSYLAPWVLSSGSFQRAMLGIDEVRNRNYRFVDSSHLDAVEQAMLTNQKNPVDEELLRLQKFIPFFDKRRNISYQEAVSGL